MKKVLCILALCAGLISFATADLLSAKNDNSRTYSDSYNCSDNDEAKQQKTTAKLKPVAKKTVAK